MLNINKKQALIYLAAAGMLTVIIPWIADMIVNHTNVSEPISIFCVIGISSLLAFMWLVDERTHIGWESLILLFGGASLAYVYFLLIDKPFTFQVSGNIEAFPLVLSVINLIIIIPFYEELVVRTFLFVGLCKFCRPWLSAIAVSLLFCLAHKNIPVLAFIVSLFLCFLTYKGTSTVNRAIFHGAYNVTLPLIALVVSGRL